MADREPEAESDADTEDEAGTGGEKTGTFVVTHTDEDSAVVRDIDTAQVLTLSSNPGLERHDVIDATVAPDPPLELSWQVVAVDDRRDIEVVDSDLEPTTHSKELAREAAEGELVRTERAGTGEIHVVRVPSDSVEAAAQDVLEDVETVARAARLEAVRVEVRRTPDAGVLSVRYLPE